MGKLLASECQTSGVRECSLLKLEFANPFVDHSDSEEITFYC